MFLLNTLAAPGAIYGTLILVSTIVTNFRDVVKMFTKTVVVRQVALQFETFLTFVVTF